MTTPSLSAWKRLNQWLFFRAERMSTANSRVGAGPFFVPSLFPWAARVEAAWPQIRGELDAVLTFEDRVPCFQDFSPEQIAITRDRRWKTFVFLAYGLRFERNCQRCPKTVEALTHIPGLRTAFFSILLPGKEIPSHRGPYNGILRYHLGVKVPTPPSSCGIMVGRETAHWRESQSLVFDDSHIHRAWNRSPDVRVVLFVDFERPLRFPASLLNYLYIRYISFGPLMYQVFSPTRKLVQPVVDT